MKYTKILDTTSSEDISVVITDKTTYLFPDDLQVSSETNVAPIVLSKNKNHQDKSTLWASVTIGFIRSTPVWEDYKDQEDSFGYLPSEIHTNVVEATLKYLGNDFNHFRGYQKSTQVVRYNHKPFVGIKTDVYTFPVRKDFEFKSIYTKGGTLTAPDKYAESVDLESYGAAYFDEPVAKPVPKLTREQELDLIISQGTL